jgi:ribosomal protein S21
LQFKASWGKQFKRPYLKKPITEKGLVEWLKMKALSSSPNTAKKRKEKRNKKPKLPLHSVSHGTHSTMW